MSLAISIIPFPFPIRHVSFQDPLLWIYNGIILCCDLLFHLTIHHRKKIPYASTSFFLMAAGYFTVWKYQIYFENVISNIWILKQYCKEYSSGWEVYLKNTKWPIQKWQRTLKCISLQMANKHMKRCSTLLYSCTVTTRINRTLLAL